MSDKIELESLLPSQTGHGNVSGDDTGSAKGHLNYGTTTTTTNNDFARPSPPPLPINSNHESAESLPSPSPVEYENENNGDHEEGTASVASSQASIISKHKGAIGMLGSISIMVNSLTGPAMLNLPALYQKAGLIPTTLAIIFVCLLSNLCSLHMSNVISKVPGNSNFQKEIEYSEAFNYFWGHKSFVFTQISFFCCVSCLNIASIVDTAQVVDHFVAHLPSGTVALEYNTTRPSSAEGGMNWIFWTDRNCPEEKRLSGHCIPFDADEPHRDTFLVTAGYVLACFLFLPMSLMDLKENALTQIIGFVVLIIISVQFIAVFLLSDGIDWSNASLWGEDWSDLFGVVLFNFAVLIAVPAWLYEKDPNVHVNSAVNQSSFIAFILYVAVGGLGALSMPDVSENMLQSMMSGGFGSLTERCSELFAFFIIGLGIPLFSVLARLNLTGSGLCSEFMANMLAVYLPWGTSWMFYAGGLTTELLGWGGVLFTSIIVFLAPLLLALHTVLEFDEDGSVAVYEGLFQSKQAQIIALVVLLLLSIGSVIFAFIGEFLSTSTA